MIRAGELGGVLDEVLLNLACVVERDRSVRQRMMSALAYPAIVALSALALVVFLVTSIVPTFRSMYAQMHVPLPWITQAVIAAGDSLRSPMLWITLVPLVAGLAIAIGRMRSSTRGALLIDGIVMRSPILGAIVRKANLARLARTLGTLLQCGVALVAALEVATDVVSSAPYRESLLALRQALSEGSGITKPLAACGIYDPMFVQMVRVGEESGALDAMMLHIAEHYEADVDTALSALGSTLEPVMILMLGGAVGFIVAAIFIPLYTLIGNIK